MKLYELFDEKLIFLQNKFKDKTEIIEFLVEQFEENDKIKDKNAILTALLEREEVNSSGVNDQIAVPHQRTDEVDEFVAAFCTLKNGVDFGSLDGQDVYFILMLLAPTKKASEYLGLLARFSRIFKKEANRKKVLEFTDPVELIDFIKSQES